MSKVTYTIHEEPISLEAAKLLGFAFTWSGRTAAYKMVPTGAGLVLRVRWMQPTVGQWEESVYHRDVSELEHALMTGNKGQPHTLYRVTFSDEGTQA